MKQGVWACPVGWLVLAVVAGLAAGVSLGRCRSTLLVDPFLGYSAVALPAWARPVLDFTAGATLSEIDGTSVTRSTMDATLNQRCELGQQDVVLTFGTSRVRAPIARWSLDEVWWFFGLFACFSGLFGWSAWFLADARADRLSRHAYQLVAWLSAAFLLSYYDYHSTRWLTGLFAGATAGLPFGLMLLAASFASEPRRFHDALAVGVRLTVVWCALVAVAVGAGADLPRLRVAVNVLIPMSLLGLALVIGWRWRTGTPAQRTTIAHAALGLVVMPVVAGAGAIVGQLRDSAAISLVVPLLGLMVPGSIGWAMLRADIFEAGRSVTRLSLAVPLVLLALLAGGVVTVGSGAEGVASVLLFGTTFALACMALSALAGRLVFRASARFKPVVEALTRDVAEARDPVAVEEAVRRAMHRFLPEVQVAFHRGEPGAVEVSMRAGDETHGLVSLVRPPVSPLLTDEDLELARVLSTIGGLAVHNAKVVRALEDARSFERQTAELSRSLTVDVVAAELAHELTYPLVYFRHFFERPDLEPGRVALGREEVARLERLVGEARRAQRATIRPDTVGVRGLATRVVALLEPQLGTLRQRCLVELPPDLRIQADPDLALQAFANLLRNASDAAPPGGQVGLLGNTDGRETVITVWDEGPGIAPGLELFVPFRSTRPAGLGLGLTVTQRIARSHGWRIEVQRRAGRTCFDVHVPASEPRA
jgi:signal transduction histidine kinase